MTIIFFLFFVYTDCLNCCVRLFFAFFQETYYVPYKKLFNKKLNAKGKLYDKYTNYLRTLRTHGLAPVSFKTETQSKPSIFLFSYLIYCYNVKEIFFL